MGGSGLDWTHDFQNFCGSGLDRIQFCRIRTGFGLKNFTVRSSLSYGTYSQKLADKIATLARNLATETILHQHISTLLVCRLVPPKKKDNGIRTVGVGECLRQIIGKAITRLLKEDIIRAAGTVQTCTRLQSGVEATIYSVRKSFLDKHSESLLLVDAENAFKKPNREISLKNIKRLCVLGRTILGECLRPLRKLVKSCSWPHHSQKWQNKLNQLFNASSMSVSMETTQNIENCNISTTEWPRTNFFLMNQN